MISDEQALDRFLQSIMGDPEERFSDRVMELSFEPTHVGELEDPDGFGYAKGSCGDEMRLFLRLKDGKIAEALFLTDGCGATLACGSAVTELAISRTPFEATGIHPQDVIRFLDGLPPSHLHCAVLAVQALRKALESIKKRARTRGSGKKP